MNVLSAKAVAAKLGVHVNTVYVWVRERSFPASFEIGCKSVWDEEDINNWLKAKKEQSRGNSNTGEAQAV